MTNWNLSGASASITIFADLHFSKMAATISSILYAQEKYDLATSPSRGAVYFSPH